MSTLRLSSLEATFSLTAVAASLERETELLREYRTRVIADVVTGKLDVRGVELPDFEDALDLAESDDIGDMNGDDEGADALYGDEDQEAVAD